jgi:hypothetical protein
MTDLVDLDSDTQVDRADVWLAFVCARRVQYNCTHQLCFLCAGCLSLLSQLSTYVQLLLRALPALVAGVPARRNRLSRSHLPRSKLLFSRAIEFMTKVSISHPSLEHGYRTSERKDLPPSNSQELSSVHTIATPMSHDLPPPGRPHMAVRAIRIPLIDLNHSVMP